MNTEFAIMGGLAALVVCAMCTAGWSHARADEAPAAIVMGETYTIAEVLIGPRTDGDSPKVRFQGIDGEWAIRPDDFDALEMNEPGGPEAAALAHEVWREHGAGSTFRPYRRDRYDRLLGTWRLENGVSMGGFLVLRAMEAARKDNGEYSHRRLFIAPWQGSRVKSWGHK